jgi:hypothetical protein
MREIKIKRIMAREGLIILGLAVALYIFTFFLLQHVPVALPKYRLEFANGEIYTITITPEIRNDSNYKKLLKEAYDPSPKLIDKRIKEFIGAGKVKSALIGARCVNSYQVYLSKLYSYLLGIAFILKLAVIYLVLLFIRFYVWAIKRFKK